MALRLVKLAIVLASWFLVVGAVIVGLVWIMLAVGRAAVDAR